MGLSSSQARLLSLTGRMHDIEYKAQKLEAQKLQLANETRRVNEDYLNALDAIKIQARSLNTDGSSTYFDATFNNLIYSKNNNNSIYIMKDIDTGKVYCSNEIRSAFVNSDKTVDGFLKTLNSLREDKSSYTSITSAEQLASLNGATGNYKLDADLVLDNWDGIKSFKGTLDGNGHTITINNSKFGLFRSTNGATLRNLELNVDITNYDRNNLGGLSATSTDTTFENCSVSGSVNGNRWIGGVVGYTLGTCTFSNSTANVNVSSDIIDESNGTDSANMFFIQSCSGGFIGGSNGSIVVNDCRSEGDVSSEYSIIGGFIGTALSSATFKNVVSTGNITANRSGLANLDVYNYSSHSRSNMYGSGTFIGSCRNASDISVENCIAYGMPTNTGSVDSKYYDFGVTYNLSSTPSTVNSYSKFAGDIIPSQSIAFPSDITTTYPNIDSSDMNYLVGMFNILNEAGGGYAVDDTYANDPMWLSNMINNGFAMLATFDIKANRLEINDTSVAVDTNLREVPDEILLKKAEAKYEADMKRIDLKDSRYDTDLAAIESERNAIKMEMETLKTVAKDNVERTFKLFS